MNVPETQAADPERALCMDRLNQLVGGNADISGALVSTVDGFEFAARVRDAASPRKLAAMSSSLLSLAEAVSDEGGVGACRDLLIDASAGRIFLMDIPSPRRRLLLMVLCSSGATLGKILWAARNTREAIGKDLEAHHAKTMLPT